MGTPEDSPRGAGRIGEREESLSIFAQVATPLNPVLYECKKMDAWNGMYGNMEWESVSPGRATAVCFNEDT